MKRLALILCCILSFSKDINANNHLQKFCFFTKPLVLFQDNGDKPTIEEKLKKHEGTFQIQVKDLRYKPNIPYNIDELIEKNRKQNETVYISLGSAVRLKILSYNEIHSNSFKKLELISSYKD